MRKKLSESQLKRYIHNKVLNELSYATLRDASRKADNIDGSYNPYAEDMTIGDAIDFLDERSSTVGGADMAMKYSRQLEEIKNFIQRKLDQRENLQNGLYSAQDKLHNSIDSKFPNDEDFEDLTSSKYHMDSDSRKQKYGLSDDELEYLDNDY